MRVLHKIRRLAGFTLTELLVVLVILAILSAAIIPSMMGYIDKSKENDAIADAAHFGSVVNVGFSEWYSAPDSHQPTSGSDVANKNEVLLSMAAMVKAECGMGASNEARAGSNRFQIVSSDMTKAKWNDFYQKTKLNPGKNRAAFYVKTVNHTYTSVAGVLYLSADGKYVVRIIYELGENGCDFTESDKGIYVQKVPS